MIDYDVIVVGFGPAGAVAACLLGQAGIRTLVVEKTHTVYEKPRAIAIDHEILRLFQNLGVAEAVLPYTEPFTASQHFGAEGQLIRRVDMVPPPYPQAHIPSMVFTQPPVEAALRAHAASFPSVEIRLGTAFESLVQTNDHVAITLDDATTVTASYAIGCDGASSRVRQAVGLSYEDLVFDEPWLVIDVMVNEAGAAKLPETAAQFCEPARPATFIIGPGLHRRWEIMLLPGEDPRVMEQEASVWALLARWLTPADGKLWRANSYRFHALVASAWRAGRVFIAGDAAHQQPPFIGQGMCQGIRDVANLVWKLEAALAGDTSLLDSYGEERGRHVRTLTSRIKAIGHAICERDPERARLRDEALIAQGGGQAPYVTRQEIVPPLETGFLAPGVHQARGTLFPQPWLTQPTGPIRMDDLVGTGWRLVLDGRTAWPSIPLPPGVTRVAIGSKGDHPEQDGVMAAWFDRHGCTAALIRPDHYVYGVATDPAEITSLLDTCFTHLHAHA